MKRINALLVGTMFLFSGCMAVAGEEHHAPKIESAAFEQFKQLKGNWKGMEVSNSKKPEIALTLELTSGGTVLLERLFSGKEHEMVTTYFPEGKNMAMTHYCSLGNQPTMRLTESSKNEWQFQFSAGTNINPEKDPHMHALKVTMLDKDRFKQEWTYFENGKEKDRSVFEFKRVK